jgi:hypothetical protein
VPIQLNSHSTLDTARTLPFCYLCGNPFEGNDRDRDHVPPSTVFDDLDQEPVLILSTHPGCNRDESQQDQQIGQLVGMLHRRRLPPGQTKIEMREVEEDDGQIRVVVPGIPLAAIIRRWVRGFHAALYGEYLPEREESFVTIPPLPAGVGSGASFRQSPQPPIVSQLTTVLQEARRRRQIDTIRLRNDTCRYDCVWTPWSGAEWRCVYGLDLYDCCDMGDRRLPRTPCVGFYRAVGTNPPVNSATLGLVNP